MPRFIAAFSVGQSAVGSVAETIRAFAPLEIAAWITPDEIVPQFMDDLAALHPFGQANPEPVFGLHRVVLRRPPETFKERHVRFTFEDTRGGRHHVVAWQMAGRVPPVGQPLDFAVKPEWNFFNGRKLLQLELIDWRPSTAPVGNVTG